MQPGEIVWRVRNEFVEAVDRMAYRRRQRILPIAEIAKCERFDELVNARGLGARDRLMDADRQGSADAWRAEAIIAADKLVAHRLDLFDLEGCDLGNDINWNYEHKARKATPTGFAPSIDYRDHSVAGDCKFAWEPSRHHHLVTLGRAYAWTGEPRYAEETLAQIDSWIDQCPFGSGMQWRSPLELGIRLINWVWAIHMVRLSDAFTRERAHRITSTAYRHLWDITRKYSRYSSANNHLIGEAAGVFIGSSYFAGLRDASRWRAESRTILLREIMEQTYPDGGTREQAFGYHLFVLQFFVLAGLVARNNGDAMTPEYWHRLEKMFEFLAALIEGGEAPPLYGDCDDGYVLELGRRLGDPRTLMCVGAILFDRSDFKALAGEFAEAACWLFGPAGRDVYEKISPLTTSGAPRSRALPESGYYLLRSGPAGSAKRVRVVFDCGELGYGAIAAHGHADALSFTLCVGGKDVLVDPGTYDYFTFQGWRNFFRGTAAHNTATVDGLDQSEMSGPFMWTSRATARCLRWLPAEEGGVVSGEHDGYQRLSDPVTHRRTLELGNEAPELRICDEILAAKDHEVCLHFHLAERCQVLSANDNRLLVDFGGGKAGLEFDPQVAVTVIQGSESPIAGWSSPSYHRKRPSPTVVALCSCRGSTTLHTRVILDEAALNSWGRRETRRADEVVCS